MQSARERRLEEIARDEASVDGYRKYEPIVRGPFLNAVLIGLLALASPFYIAWRKLLSMLDQIKQGTAVIAAFGLLVLGLAYVYRDHFDNAFQFDDSHTIVDNRYITDVRNIPLFFTHAETGSSLPTNQAYRPVVTTLNAIDYGLAGGLDVRVFHWHIFAEFILILALIYALCTGLFKLACGEPQRWVALLAAAFFGLHAATAETINYVIARSDVFSTLMVLAGLVIFMRNEGWRRHWAIVPFIVGCLTKPTALMLAPILAMYSLFMIRPSILVRGEQPAIAAAAKRAVSSTGSYFVIGAMLYAFTASMASKAWTPGGAFSGAEYLVTQVWVIWIYIKTFVLPTGLTADTDMEVIRSLLDPRVLWGSFVIVLMLAAAWMAALRRFTLPVTFGILWFFIALVPSSSIIPLAEVMNHHRTFFPYIGLAISTVWAGYLLLDKLAGTARGTMAKWTAGIAITLVLTAHAWGTAQRNEVWHSPESLWLDVTFKSPDNGRGLMNYGLALMRKGDIDGALGYFERARSTSYGNHPYLFINLAIATNQLAIRNESLQQREEAEAYFRLALQRGSNYPQTHYRYAEWLHRQGRDDEALQHVNQAILLAPANGDALSLRESLVQSAQTALETAIQLAEEANTPEAWLNLSLKQYNTGNYPGCIEAAQRALGLRPGYALAYNNICSAHNMLGRYEEAIVACERALELDPGFELARNNLAWARQQLESP